VVERGPRKCRSVENWERMRGTSEAGLKKKKGALWEEGKGKGENCCKRLWGGVENRGSLEDRQPSLNTH